MEFAQFFTQMHWAVIMLLVLCLVLLIVEAIIPGFGICGVSGIAAGVAAVICEAIFTKSLFDVFFLIFIILLVFTILFIIFSHSFNKGLLKKTPLVEDGTAIPKDYGKHKHLENLIGKEGEVISICKPVGKAIIEGKTYTVCSTRGTIYPGEMVKVAEIKDNTIKVEYIGGENE